MSDRVESSSIRTIRPDAGEPGGSTLPSVAEILRTDAVAAGAPEVLVGGPMLTAPVRWVHVSDSPGVARLLDGGELLLTTGSSWPDDPRELEAMIDDLAAAGLVGIVLELGAHYRYVPAVIREAARSAGLALVALRREVKFVAVTEIVHRRIISEQTEALRARDDVRTLFTALAVRGAPTDFLIDRLGQTLASPVVLETLAHEVVLAHLPPGSAPDVLRDWERTSRRAHRDPAADHRLIVPVEARGIRWGYLVALPGPAHPAGRLAVLEQAATALALGRLADPSGDEWQALARSRVLDALLAGRYTDLAEAAVRVEGTGLGRDGAVLYGLAVRAPHLDQERADRAARGLGGRALCGSALSAPDPAAGWHPLLLSLPAGEELDDAAASRLARALGDGDVAARLTIGEPARATATGADLSAALTSLDEATDLARGGSDGGTVRRAQYRPLSRLVSALRDDHRLLDHGERLLAPLLDDPRGRAGILLPVLAALLAHPTNRTAAAEAAHLSRSVFYQRLAVLEEVLGLALDDGETLAALHVALLVQRARGGSGRTGSPATR